MTHITIIGGGIAGLATAFYLQKKKQEQNLSLTYSLIEAAPQFGGKITTNIVEDFVIEGGPDSFITQKPWGIQLCRDLGLTDRLIPTNDDQRNIYILNKRKLVPFPGGFRLTVPTEFIPFAFSTLISPWGKLRMGMDLFIPPRPKNGDESLASFIRRRLGEEALDKFAGPLMAGIYTADPERLSMQSAFPRFVEMERKHGSLIKAMQAAKKKRPPATERKSSQKPNSMFTSLRGGMSELVESLLQHLDGDLRSNCRVTEIQPLASGFEVNFERNDIAPLKTDAIVLAVPAYTAANLLEPVDSQLAEKLRQIRYVSTGTVSLAYNKADIPSTIDLDGFGFLIPKSENRQILACTWSSTKFDHRAPEDGVLLRFFVGGDKREHLVDLPDDELVDLVQSEIADIMNITAEPITYKIFRWRKGSPQYDVGHLDRVAELEAQTAKTPGLYLTGSAFRGIGIPDCIKSALNTTEQLITTMNLSLSPQKLESA